MKAFQIKILQDSSVEKVLEILQKLADENIIAFSQDSEEEAEEATEEQVQEMIDEAELAPYYSEDEAKKILNL